MISWSRKKAVSIASAQPDSSSQLRGTSHIDGIEDTRTDLLDDPRYHSITNLMVITVLMLAVMWAKLIRVGETHETCAFSRSKESRRQACSRHKLRDELPITPV